MYWNRVATPEGGLDVLFAGPHHLPPPGLGPAFLVQKGRGVVARELVPDPGNNLGQTWRNDFGPDFFARFAIRHSILTFGNIERLPVNPKLSCSSQLDGMIFAGVGIGTPDDSPRIVRVRNPISVIRDHCPQALRIAT